MHIQVFLVFTEQDCPGLKAAYNVSVEARCAGRRAVQVEEAMCAAAALGSWTCSTVVRVQILHTACQALSTLRAAAKCAVLHSRLFE